jgi:hypothetical protein
MAAVLPLVAAATACCAVSTAAPNNPGDACASVYLIVARGTNEPPGEGHTADLVARIKQSSRQSITDVAVDYPAAAKSLSGYADSSAEGTTALRQMLTYEVRRCPAQKIAMLGYSQGAHIIGDAIGGGGGGGGGGILGPQTSPVPGSVSDHVLAVVQMGDPRHMADLPFDVGTSSRNGRFPRAGDQQLTPFADRVRSYCDTGDPFCGSGRLMPVHFTYLRKYGDDPTQFVVDAVGG